MKIIEFLKGKVNDLKAEVDKHSVGVGDITDEFERGMIIGKQRALQQVVKELTAVIVLHSCRNCGALIDNDADSVNGLCLNCAKGERDDNL